MTERAHATASHAKPHAAAARSHTAANVQAAPRKGSFNDPAKKEITRMDPNELQRQRAVDLHNEDPEHNPPIQQGMSSSELNTAHPDMKKQATKEAQALPSNTSPDGAPTERQAGTAQKKFDKEHQD